MTRPVVFFDLETTGLDMEYDKIIQFAGVKYYPDRDEPEILDLLISPGIPVSEEIEALTKITNKMLVDKPSFLYVANKIYDFVNDCDLAGFNVVKFDVPFLVKEFSNVGQLLNISNINIIDVCNIYKKKEQRNLSAACKLYLDHDHSENAHNALGDTKATVDVFFAQLKRYNDLPKSTDELSIYSKFDTNVEVYDDEGKIAKSTNGPVYNFGKHKGIKIVDEPGYARWMLKSDFSDSTKEVLRKVLKGEIK